MDQSKDEVSLVQVCQDACRMDWYEYLQLDRRTLDLNKDGDDKNHSCESLVLICVPKRMLLQVYDRYRRRRKYVQSSDDVMSARMKWKRGESCRTLDWKSRGSQ